MKFKLKYSEYTLFTALTAATFALAIAALLMGHANASTCTRKAADTLITKRYKECSPKKYLSFLYNNMVTAYSYTCANRIQDTCKKENCAKAATVEEKAHCDESYVQVLNECESDLEGAALMARCKDTKNWVTTTATLPVSPKESRMVREPTSTTIASDSSAERVPHADNTAWIDTTGFEEVFVPGEAPPPP